MFDHRPDRLRSRGRAGPGADPVWGGEVVATLYPIALAPSGKRAGFPIERAEAGATATVKATDAVFARLTASETNPRLPLLPLDNEDDADGSDVPLWLEDGLVLALAEQAQDDFSPRRRRK